MDIVLFRFGSGLFPIVFTIEAYFCKITQWRKYLLKIIQLQKNMHEDAVKNSQPYYESKQNLNVKVFYFSADYSSLCNIKATLLNYLDLKTRSPQLLFLLGWNKIYHVLHVFASPTSRVQSDLAFELFRPSITNCFCMEVQSCNNKIVLDNFPNLISIIFILYCSKTSNSNSKFWLYL